VDVSGQLRPELPARISVHPASAGVSPRGDFVKQVFDRPSVTPSAIVIVGSGVVGTATGEGFLELGHDVTFVDISPRRVRELQDRGLNASTTVDLPADRAAFIILTLPTPNVGHAYDLSAFTEGTAAVGRALATSAPAHTVVVRSTVPPGTSDELVRPVLERESGKTAGTGFELASNPEFLRAATAVEDFRNPWMTVIASRHPQTIARMRELLAPFGGEVRTFSEPASAELVKCAHNIYNAAKISFWNEMWLVCQRLGLAADDIATTVSRSAEASTNPDYGIRGGAPYGGACLPKDTRGFLGLAERIGVPMPLLSAVVQVNDALERLVARELSEAGDPVIELEPRDGLTSDALAP
jgi:UDPglucose 6-dehydrogenase